MKSVYIAPAPARVCIGYGRYGSVERRMNLIADVCEYELVRQGIKTARAEAQSTVTEAVAEANVTASGIYISLISQCSNGKEKGCEIFYRNRETDSQRLALDIQDSVKTVTDCKTKESSNEYGGLSYYELCKTKAPAVIVAIGFHDNPADAEFIINNTYEIGCAVSRGIAQYFGIEYREDLKQSADTMRASYNGVIF